DRAAPLRAGRPASPQAIGKLVVADDGISVVVRLACAAESFEYCIGRDRAIQDFARGVELVAFFRVDRHSRIDDLEDMIRPDREAIIRWITERGGALRALKTEA